MPTQTKKFSGLTGNQLKIIALIAMTCDHVGLQLFPDVLFLRIIGRLALPIFAYMIAEGCRYTRSPKKYLLTILGVAVLCQVVYFAAMGSLYQCILVTFTLSILLIQSLDRARNQEDHQTAVTTALIWAGVVFVCVGLPLLLDHTDFAIDYGLWGVLLPVLIYLGRDQKEKLLLTGAGLVLLALSFTGMTQWFSLLTLPLLALYNGQRGKRKMKYFFYVYYPLHLAVIYGISLLMP